MTIYAIGTPISTVNAIIHKNAPDLKSQNLNATTLTQFSQATLDLISVKNCSLTHQNFCLAKAETCNKCVLLNLFPRRCRQLKIHDRTQCCRQVVKYVSTNNLSNDDDAFAISINYDEELHFSYVSSRVNLVATLSDSLYTEVDSLHFNVCNVSLNCSLMAESYIYIELRFFH